MEDLKSLPSTSSPNPDTKGRPKFCFFDWRDSEFHWLHPRFPLPNLVLDRISDTALQRQLGHSWAVPNSRENASNPGIWSHGMEKQPKSAVCSQFCAFRGPARSPSPSSQIVGKKFLFPNFFKWQNLLVQFRGFGKKNFK